MMAGALSFMIAGMQKAGTTAAWAALSQHPDLVFGPRKEMHVFDDERRDWRRPDLADLHASYPDDGRLRGDATPVTTFWPGALERLAACCPAIRLVILLRDPVERAHAHWRMQRARGIEPLSFGWAIRGGRARVRSGAAQDLRRFSYVERGFYAPQLSRLTALFPKDQWLALTIGDLWHRPEATLDRICCFLGVEPFSVHPPNRTVFSHAGPGAPELAAADAAHLQALYRDDAEDTLALLDRAVSPEALYPWLGGPGQSAP